MAAVEAGIKTFLIADVRGYTSFTQERGDEAAARLATRFAELAREAIEGAGGTLVELRGDEALAVFDSARQALRAASDLQERFVAETVADPRLPLAVGIGLDAGEAVPVDGGYRGGALNLAARLCCLAGPGEVLASPGVAHLARKVEGLEYVERGPCGSRGSSSRWRSSPSGPSVRTWRATSRSAERSIPQLRPRWRRATHTRVCARSPRATLRTSSAARC